MLKIGVVGCGLQAATIAGYMGVYNDDYEVSVVVDIDFENARSRMAQKQVRIAEDCRFSTLTKVCYHDGKKTSSSHHAWFAVNYDLFSIDNGAYPYMSTVNGLGEEVTLTYPDGMISWLSQFTSDYDGTPSEGTGNIDARIGLIDTLIKLFAKMQHMNVVNVLFLLEEVAVNGWNRFARN